MRASWVLFAVAFAEMTLDAEEEEGMLSGEQLDEMYPRHLAARIAIIAESGRLRPSGAAS